MDIDATRAGNGGGGRGGGNWNGKSRDDFLWEIRGRCFSCGSPNHIRGNCNMKNKKCRYCARTRHVERVCQDRYMGLEKNRGAGKTGGGGARISANTETPFSLFNNTAPTAGPSQSSACINDSTNEIQALKEAMAQQTAILAAFMKERKDF